MALDRPEGQSSHILIILRPFKTYHSITSGKCKVMSNQRIGTQQTGMIKNFAKYPVSREPTVDKDGKYF